MWSNDFQQGCQDCSMAERTVFSTDDAWETVYQHAKESILTLYIKYTWKWIQNLCTKAKTVKHLEENIEENLHDIGFGGDFLDMTLKTQATKDKIGRFHN